MTTEDRNRLDAAVLRAAGAAVGAAPPKASASFLEVFGPTLAPIAQAHEQARRQEARAKLEQLSAALAVAREALEVRTAAQARELAVLQQAMEEQHNEWLRACGRYETQRRAHQFENVPLLDRIASLVTELNAPPPGWGHNIRQWQPRDDLPQGPLE